MGVFLLSSVNLFYLQGGFFLWLKLPENINGKEFQKKAKAENLLVMDGSQ